MSLLFSALWPIAVLTALFVVFVYLVRYIIFRFVSIK